jgi:hypothetical protein
LVNYEITILISKNQTLQNVIQTKFKNFVFQPIMFKFSSRDSSNDLFSDENPTNDNWF